MRATPFAGPLMKNTLKNVGNKERGEDTPYQTEGKSQQIHKIKCSSGGVVAQDNLDQKWLKTFK